MPFMIFARDKPGAAARRAELRPAHLEYLTGHTARLLAAGAMLGDDGATPCGSLILLDTMLLIYFIPYIYLFICYMRVSLREPSPGPQRWSETPVASILTGSAGLLLTLGAMVVATIPPSDTPDPWIFRLKVIGVGLAVGQAAG